MSQSSSMLKIIPWWRHLADTNTDCCDNVIMIKTRYQVPVVPPAQAGRPDGAAGAPGPHRHPTVRSVPAM